MQNLKHGEFTKTLPHTAQPEKIVQCVGFTRVAQLMHVMLTQACNINLCKRPWSGQSDKRNNMLAALCVCVTHREITLVAYQHDGHVGVCMLPSIIQPAG